MPQDMQTLFDFNQPADAQHWRPIDDIVMGGISSSQFQVEPGGVGVFSGSVSLANNGGFASVRSRPARCNLRAYTGLELRVRSDGKTYQLRLRDNPAFDGVSYTVSFSTPPGEWQQLQFPFHSFQPTFRGRTLTNAPPLSSGTIYSFGFMIASKQSGSFRLEIDWVCAYK